jgi:hypothetical protein
MAGQLTRSWRRRQRRRAGFCPDPDLAARLASHPPRAHAPQWLAVHEGAAPRRRRRLGAALTQGPPMLTLDPDKVCHIIVKARAFDQRCDD